MNKKEKLVPKLRFSEFSGEWENGLLKKYTKINPKNSELPEEFIYIDLESVENGVLKKINKIKKFDAPSRAQRLLKNNDILYQTVRPYQKNNLFFYSKKNGYFVASTGYAQIRTKENSHYLYYYLHYKGKFNAYQRTYVLDELKEHIMYIKYFLDKSLKKRITQEKNEGNTPYIVLGTLRDMKINLPSLPEQEKIANFLSSLDTKIEFLEREIEKNKEFKKGLLQHMFV